MGVTGVKYRRGVLSSDQPPGLLSNKNIVGLLGNYKTFDIDLIG